MLGSVIVLGESWKSVMQDFGYSDRGIEYLYHFQLALVGVSLFPDFGWN
jgi:hypothetical protein